MSKHVFCVWSWSCVCSFSAAFGEGISLISQQPIPRLISAVSNSVLLSRITALWRMQWHQGFHCHAKFALNLRVIQCFRKRSVQCRRQETEVRDLLQNGSSVIHKSTQERSTKPTELGFWWRRSFRTMRFQLYCVKVHVHHTEMSGSKANQETIALRCWDGK